MLRFNKYLTIFSGLVTSIMKIGGNILFNDKVKVIFYYPQHFNRIGGKNPYFEPLLEICLEHKISYLVLEEPEFNTNNPRNSNAIPSDVIHYVVLLVRKALTLLNISFWEREKILAFIINVCTFYKFKVQNYITISGNMSEIFQCMNPNAKVFDVQHGVIFSKQVGYFESNGKLRSILSNPNLHFLVSGEGYRKCFNLHGNNDEVMNRVHVIGSNHVKSLNQRDTADIILFSLQFVPDFSDDELIRMKNDLIDVINSIEFENYSVVLKLHPRFANAINISDILIQHPKIILVNDGSYNQKAKLHVTLTSTTTFEFAEMGVPTFFIPSTSLVNGKTIFYDEYNYPLYFGKNLKEVLDRISVNKNYEKDCTLVREWAEEFYSPIDERAFLALIN